MRAAKAKAAAPITVSTVDARCRRRWWGGGRWLWCLLLLFWNMTFSLSSSLSLPPPHLCKPSSGSASALQRRRRREHGGAARRPTILWGKFNQSSMPLGSGVLLTIVSRVRDIFIKMPLVEYEYAYKTKKCCKVEKQKSSPSDLKSDIE